MINLRSDILPEELTEEQAKILVQQGLEQEITKGQRERTRTPGRSKSLHEFVDLVRMAIEDREKKSSTSEDSHITLTEEFSDIDQNSETLTFSLVERKPGQWAEGPANSGGVRNRRPILREVEEDPHNPGYKIATFGTFYDNIIKFTCWARTNKRANWRARWFQDLMEDYMFFFTIRGTNRVLFEKQEKDEMRDTTSTKNSTTNKYYGRPMLYFVRTEKLRTVSQKELEQLVINYTVSQT